MKENDIKKLAEEVNWSSDSVKSLLNDNMIIAKKLQIAYLLYPNLEKEINDEISKEVKIENEAKLRALKELSKLQ